MSNYLFPSKIESEVLKCYMDKLPEKIFVKVAQDKNGKYWAGIEVENDTLFTEANTRDKLEENVNRAVACYFEVRKEYIPYLLINKQYIDPTLERKKVFKAA